MASMHTNIAMIKDHRWKKGLLQQAALAQHNLHDPANAVHDGSMHVLVQPSNQSSNPRSPEPKQCRSGQDPDGCHVNTLTRPRKALVEKHLTLVDREAETPE